MYSPAFARRSKTLNAANRTVQPARSVILTVEEEESERIEEGLREALLELRSLGVFS